MSSTLREKIFTKSHWLGSRQAGKDSENTDDQGSRLEILQDSHLVMETFLRLRDGFLRQHQASAHPVPAFRLEYGHAAKERPYFFVSPWHENGWLFEITRSGWVVTVAERIVHQETYLRSSQPWDMVVLYSRHERSNPCVRIQSQLLVGQLMTLPLYQLELETRLPLDSSLL